MKLPDKRTKANANPLAYSVYLYGEPKTGKTTWAAQNPDALFLATEPGTKALEVYELPAKAWSDLTAALHALQQDHSRYKAVVVDTIDLAYELCTTHYCEQHRLEHISQHDFGRGYGVVADMFRRWLAALCRLDLQVILIGHCKYRDKTKTTPAKYVPACPAKAQEVIKGLVDTTIFVEGHKDGSVAHCQDGAAWTAGCRVAEMPASMPMDYTAYMETLTKALKSQKGKAKAGPANTEGMERLLEDDTATADTKAEADDDLPF